MSKIHWRAMMALLCAGSVIAASCGSDDEGSTAGAGETTTTANSGDSNTNSGDTNSGNGGTDASRPDDWPTTITFGAVPSEEATSLEASFETTRKILTDELGLEEIAFAQATDYAGVVEGIIAGRVDVAQFGPFSYVIAVKNGADLSVAGVQVSGPDEEPGYRSYAVTRPGSGITSLDDFRGKRICFVDPSSTSGFLFPSEGLLAAGIDPSETSTDITPVFAGGHDASALTVKAGDCDAGFVYDTMLLLQLTASGDIAGVIDSVENEDVNPDNAELEIIWKSQIIAGAPMAISNTLPSSFVDAYTEVVTTKLNADWALANGYCTGTVAENDCNFGDEAGTWGFVARDDSFYDGIRQVCDITGAANCN